LFRSRGNTFQEFTQTFATIFKKTCFFSRQDVSVKKLTESSSRFDGDKRGTGDDLRTVLPKEVTFKFNKTELKLKNLADYFGISPRGGDDDEDLAAAAGVSFYWYEGLHRILEGDVEHHKEENTCDGYGQQEPCW
jgi:hypothetical protein